MKALIYRHFGPAENIQWVDGWPKPKLDPESVILQATAGGLNPKDILLRKGMFSKTLARDPLPRVSGMDVSGIVAEVGDQVTHIKVGDHVFGMTNHFSGGLHCEFAKLNQGEVAKAPLNIPLENASTVPLAALTALQALRDCGRLKSGQRVLINGASGGVGHFAVQIAKIFGAQVDAVCSHKNTHFVQSLGADTVHDYRLSPAHKIDAQFDLVFDVFGKMTRKAFSKQLLKSGIYVSTVPKLVNFWGEALGRLGISKVNRLVEVKSNAKDLSLLKGWIEQEQLVPFVEKVYPVEQAADAHRHIETKHTVGKICIKFD
ncbi:NAD(P)-dependent alcohol dehydrogenase [Aliikangiella marina]|uniref:NAD(P)-dependent alcohol dehydrogenase n=1 Tax=Aliikangiella marina TaxID=1712262 RepID=A0A545T2V0_9GAMM|nr:NAD(P)-dependent alcohol dehydrogenase [Aliikangiella marina]TQV71544.1 NAD(P)-dependent alcohol dehydrogenase [Aliikangiella marina]